MGLRSTSIVKIEDKASKLQSFTQGNVWAQRVSSTQSAPIIGKLAGMDKRVFNKMLEMNTELYVFYSFQTPIAWYNPLVGYYVSSQCHSVTTTQHTNAITGVMRRCGWQKISDEVQKKLIREMYNDIVK